jgi:hypothetical protein
VDLHFLENPTRAAGFSGSVVPGTRYLENPQPVAGFSSYCT